MKTHSTTEVELRRLARGWSQRELARRAKLSQRTIWAVEWRAQVRVATQRQILKAFGLDFADRDKLFDSRSSNGLSRSAR